MPRRTEKPHVGKRFLVDSRGRKIAVVIPIREYEDLLEDLHDLATIAARANEPRIPWEDVKREMDEEDRRSP